MGRLIQTAESSHWYLKDGTPFYETECKSKPGTMRPVTLADARKVGAVPSVTTIDKIVANKGLERWKVEQYILASLTLPRLDDESDEMFASRIVEDAMSYSKDAADLGTGIHDAIEKRLNGKDYDQPVYGAYVSAFDVWWKAFGTLYGNGNEIDFKTEQSFASPLGYGGRVDLQTWGRIDWVIDFKSTKTQPGKKYVSYRSHLRQLAAYANGLGRQHANIGIVAISTSEPGRIEFYDWTEHKDRGWKAFRCAQHMWCDENDYFPQENK